MAGLTGLTGLSGPAANVAIVEQPELDAQGRLGGTADPAHGQPYVLSPPPYPWEQITGTAPQYPQPPPDGLTGADPSAYVPAAGTLGQDPYADLTPQRTHAAPWPKGVETTADRSPDATGRQLEQSAQIHASNTGGSRRLTAAMGGLARQDDWALIDRLQAGDTLQDPDISPQLKSAAPGAGYGSHDRVSSLARQNEYGFDSAHMQRRYAQNNRGSIPGNHMWMKPGSRPLAKGVAGPARLPVGDVSPFAGQDTRAPFTPYGAVLTATPAQYQSPPEPDIAPQAPGTSPSDVAWW